MHLQTTLALSLARALRGVPSFMETHAPDISMPSQITVLASPECEAALQGHSILPDLLILKHRASPFARPDSTDLDLV